MIDTQLLDRMLQRAVDSGVVPGVVALAASDDSVVYSAAFGSRELGKTPAMDLDTVVWIASMTKLITSIAALQLVEQGRIGLDEPVGAIVPEMAEVKVLDGFDEQGEPRLRAPLRPITLRHLLSHTSGYSYRTWNPDLHRYQNVVGIPDPTKGKKASFVMPLVCDPGDRWEYGISTDWAGQVVENVSGQTLESNFRTHILDPLGMHDTGFVLRPAVSARLASLHARRSDGTFEVLPSEEPAPSDFYGGGGDAYSTGPDYLRLLRMVLAGGQLDGIRVLRPETVAQMSQNQIGELTTGVLKSVEPAASHDIEFFPGVTKTWGLATQITSQDSATGRAAGSLNWAGIFNTYFWIDPIRQVTGVFLTQILPFGDPQVLDLFTEFERAVYAGRI